MADPKAAQVTQLKNIQTKTGKSIQALHDALAKTGLTKVGEKRSWLMETYKLGYGDANAVALFVGKIPAELTSSPSSIHAEVSSADGDPLDTLYAGPKAHLRPLHEAVMSRVKGFGAFDEAPKKTYISLRRKKQFAMIGPATKDTIEIGLNAKNLPSDARLKVLPPGGMCQATTRISKIDEIDADVVSWLQQAYDSAG
jgi:hypothetical protein